MFANIKGMREPVFEYDFLPDLDIMREITNGPYVAKIIEFGLFNCLT